MKKKFRKIVIDEVDWAWQFYAKGDYYGTQNLKIWKDKKLILDKGYFYNREKKNYKITPGLISRFIKRYLRNGK